MVGSWEEENKGKTTGRVGLLLLETMVIDGLDLMDLTDVIDWIHSIA